MRLWDDNPCWTTKKSGLQKPLCGCIFLLCSCITLVCFTIYFIGSRSTSTLWLSFLFPTWLQWNLSFSTSLFKRQFHSEDTKFYPRKLLSLYLLPLLKGHLLPGKRDTNFFWVPKTRFNLHSGDTLAPKTWLITKRVDNFKCTVITMMSASTNWTISLKSMYCTCEKFNTQSGLEINSFVREPAGD